LAKCRFSEFPLVPLKFNFSWIFLQIRIHFESILGPLELLLLVIRFCFAPNSENLLINPGFACYSTGAPDESHLKHLPHHLQDHPYLGPAQNLNLPLHHPTLELAIFKAPKSVNGPFLRATIKTHPFVG
jgi:hypothetical protein